MSNNENVWTVKYPNQKTEDRIEILKESDSYIKGRWKRFEAEVTTNPFFHHKHKRIMKFKDGSFPSGTYRYRNDPLRVVYMPVSDTKTIYPLEANTTNKISYKKKK